MDKWVRQLKEERNGGSSLPNALTPDQRKIKELKKKIRQIEEEKEIFKRLLGMLQRMFNKREKGYKAMG